MIRRSRDDGPPKGLGHTGRTAARWHRGRPPRLEAPCASRRLPGLDLPGMRWSRAAPEVSSAAGGDHAALLDDAHGDADAVAGSMSIAAPSAKLPAVTRRKPTKGTQHGSRASMGPACTTARPMEDAVRPVVERGQLPEATYVLPDGTPMPRPAMDTTALRQGTNPNRPSRSLATRRGSILARGRWP